MTIPATHHSLRVDIVDAPVGRYLPALDGVVEDDRAQAADLDQLGQRWLDLAGLVGAPRLQDGLAPVPLPVEPEARVREWQDRFLEASIPPGLSAVRRDLDAADEPTARPCQPPDLVEPRTRQPLAARGERDHRLRLHDEPELSGFAVRHEGGVHRAFHARHVGPVHDRDTAQPLDVGTAFPARHAEPQWVAILRAQSLAVLAVGDQDIVQRLRQWDTVLVAAGIGALSDDPRSALLHAGFTQQERERHTGPLAAARA